MQNKKKFIPGLISILLIIGLLLVSNLIFADSPPPPPDHGQTGNEVPGGGAPIGEGMLLLTALGAAYGVKNWYKKNKQDMAD